MIAIIDYGMGNVRSVFNAFDFIGEKVEVTCDPKKIGDASRIVLPGVGAFGRAMSNLNSRGLVEVLDREVIEKGKPFLGICLGMQLLAQNSSEHGTTKGLGWISGNVKLFDGIQPQLKLPHMGWNDITPTGNHPVFETLKENHFCFYFVHSYHMILNNQEDISAICEYGYEFAAAVAKDNIFATQFHPEKSQDNGIQVIENFVKWEC